MHRFIPTHSPRPDAKEAAPSIRNELSSREKQKIRLGVDLPSRLLEIAKRKRIQDEHGVLRTTEQRSRRVVCLKSSEVPLPQYCKPLTAAIPAEKQ
ncbi:MAG: hypothetical protein KDK78_10125, partial [Chlamydiia bacterium]|nr:hypothetical protein [Chlamydiia bacterium]